MIKESKISVSSKPTVNQLNQIEKWLIEEDEESNEGFYCNWNLIKSSADDKLIFIISFDSFPIGFITWHESSDLTVTIDIAETKPSHRGKGILKQILPIVFTHFNKKGVLVVDLQCAPESSEPIWRKLGFIDFPETNGRAYWEGGNKMLYQTIVPISSFKSALGEDEGIELWSDEPYCTENIESTWSWQLEFIEGTRNLKNPIIHPCLNDWRVRWKRNGKVFKDDKAKYLIKNRIVHSKFLIINCLPVSV